MIFLIFLVWNVVAQEEIEDPSVIQFNGNDTLVDVAELYKEKIQFTEKKKKIRRNEFYGIKTKKAFTRSGSGNRTVTELFFVVKPNDKLKPSAYSPEIYWYDVRTRKIRNSRITEKDKPYVLILHGPYKKLMGNQVIEEGIFYLGSKHGRWMIHDKNNILIDKRKYNKGFDKESKITYYDDKLTKINEVIPLKGLIREGKYVKFYPSGNLEIEGYYENDCKIGLWIEYYDRFGFRKREIKYPDIPDCTANPVIEREWDSNGKLLFDKFPGNKTKQNK